MIIFWLRAGCLRWCHNYIEDSRRGPSIEANAHICLWNACLLSVSAVSFATMAIIKHFRKPPKSAWYLKSYGICFDDEESIGVRSTKWPASMYSRITGQATLRKIFIKERYAVSYYILLSLKKRLYISGPYNEIMLRNKISAFERMKCNHRRSMRIWSPISARRASSYQRNVGDAFQFELRAITS